MTRGPVRLAAVALVLVAALALKVARYAAPSEASLVEAAARVATFMAAHGWQPVGTIERRTGGFYSRIVFAHAACETSVVVAFLGGNAENAALVTLDHEGDVAFVQDGAVLEEPSGLSRQVDGLVSGLRRLVNPDQPSPLPVLAVWPAPSQSADACNGPPPSAWAEVRQAATRGADISRPPEQAMHGLLISD